MASSEYPSERYTSSLTTDCNICGKTCGNRGFARHFSACQKKKDQDDEWAALQAERRAADVRKAERSRKRRQRAVAVASPYPSAHDGPAVGPQNVVTPEEQPLSQLASSSLQDTEPVVPSVEEEQAQQAPPSSRPPSPPLLSPPPRAPNTPPTPPQRVASTSIPPPNISNTPGIDDIRVEYHPKSIHKTVIYPFDEYRQQRPTSGFAATMEEPWTPFETREDFELAEIIHEARMSHALTERLLKLINKRAWEHAAQFYPTFSVSTVAAEYKGVKEEFQFQHRPLWGWIEGQVQDPKLVPYFHWDAQRLYKYDGTRWVRYIEEPWTADMFWDVQTHITDTDEEGKPLGLIVWADKDKLSTFGSQQGHPIVVRLSNLDSAVRNSLGPGGGRIVGLVLVIKDEASEKGKKNYIDWKHAVYHESFKVLLEEVAIHSRTGYKLRCGDNQLRTLFPFIHIITADYEEQCFFALTRGLRGLRPCPVCVVPEGELSDLKTTYPERHVDIAQELVEKIEGKGVKEVKLKILGLRAVENAMWGVMRTNIYKAISFDRLHAYLLGLFLHLLRILLLIIDEMKREQQAFVDNSINAVPSWPGLTHFKSLTGNDFNDGAKWADLSKIIIQCCYSIFPAHSSGYNLLKALRKYIECDTFVALSVHTEDTLKDYDDTIQQFGSRLQEYTENPAVTSKGVAIDKDWDGIIKMHSHLHASRDIRLKGVMANMDTKSSEKLHGPLRKAYLMQTNFKNVESQLARLDDYSMVLCDIRGNVDARDEYLKSQKTAEQQMKKGKAKEIMQFNNIYLGSPNKSPTTIAALALSQVEDEAFHDFRKKLITCVRDLVGREEEGDRLQTTEPFDRRNIEVHATDQVLQYQLLRVDYESKVTWREVQDILRCSPSFHGATRHDAVIFNHGNRTLFGELVYAFTYKFKGATCTLALIHPFDTSLQLSGARRIIDRDLGLCRLKERRRVDSIIVPLRAVTRGALVVVDASRPGNRLVIDTLDEDMFLRCIDLFPDRDMATQIRLRL
ncbi:hypothetical protein BC629DRAFT_1736243 [Irpex lacteus]|nr:hypothetical protein BC629DRAFT_1736243 [Irpex lacteus]